MTTAHSNSQLGRAIRRSEIIERAESWLRPPVAYSQTKFHQNDYGIYRTDCSGYVSMTWGLPGIPTDRHGGFDTIGLTNVSLPVCEYELLAGDILLRTDGTNLTRHVTLFHEWADDHRTSYWGFEQLGGVGTIHHLISYSYNRDSEHYTPRRYRHLSANK